MRRIFLSLAFMGLLLTNAFAGEIYENADFKFKVKFPAEYEASTESEDDYQYLSVTCVYGSMIYLVSAYIWEEEVPEDEYLTKTIESLATVMTNYNTKFKKKTMGAWEMDDMVGLSHPIKGYIMSDGSKLKLFGMLKTIMVHGVDFRLVALSTSKKGYDEASGNKFFNSFESFLD